MELTKKKCLENDGDYDTADCLNESQQVKNSYINKSLKELMSIDWTFSIRSNVHEIEALHSYPAKFISDIPKTFLNILPLPKNTAVLDPFCGSGTTLLESQKKGISSIGIDLNPIACLISRVKTSPTPIGFERTVIEVSQDAKNIRDPIIPAIPNLDHWFKSEVQDATAALI